jgi:hypothetical protein
MTKLSDIYGLNTILTDEILNNDTSHAPDGNTVYDALALKANLISPSLVTAILGTPASGNLVNCTFPTLNQNTSGTAANLSGTPTLPTGTTLVAPVLGTPASGVMTACTAATAADNTATTALASTAFAKSQDAVLARLPNQAVNMTYAASGSSGITVADNTNINFGTGNFTLVWRGSLPDWTPSGFNHAFFRDMIQHQI